VPLHARAPRHVLTPHRPLDPFPPDVDLGTPGVD